MLTMAVRRSRGWRRCAEVRLTGSPVRLRANRPSRQRWIGGQRVPTGCRDPAAARSKPPAHWGRGRAGPLVSSHGGQGDVAAAEVADRRSSLCRPRHPRPRPRHVTRHVTTTTNATGRTVIVNLHLWHNSTQLNCWLKLSWVVSAIRVHAYDATQLISWAVSCRSRVNWPLRLRFSSNKAQIPLGRLSP